MQPKWHKLPPVPGWYVVAQMAGGKVDGCGCAFYSKWRISGLYEEKTFRFYGPLPVEGGGEMSNEHKPMTDEELAEIRELAEAANHKTVLALLDEVERLRGEVARLNEAVNRWQDECESAQRCADIATQQVNLLAKKLFDNRICHKAVLCKQENAKERRFEGEDGCGFCWEEWAWHLAAYDIEEAKRNAE